MNRLQSSWKGSRTITKVNLIIGAVLMVVFAYVSITLYFGAASQVRFASNDFPGAKKAATTFLKLSPIERHIGYFNRGTAEATVGQFDNARTDLESALELTPPRDECAVRINLSFVYEKQGDAIVDQDAKKSDELYAQALATLRDAPKECRPDKSEEQKKTEEAQKRVEEKKNPQKPPEGEEQPPDGDQGDKDEKEQDGDQGKGNSGEEEKKPEESEGEGDGQKSETERKKDELRERGKKSEQEQQQPGSDGGSRTTPDKPW